MIECEEKLIIEESSMDDRYSERERNKNDKKKSREKSLKSIVPGFDFIKFTSIKCQLWR